MRKLIPFDDVIIKLHYVKVQNLKLARLILLNSLRPSEAYIYVGKPTITDSNDGLSPGRRQAII